MIRRLCQLTDQSEQKGTGPVRVLMRGGLLAALVVIVGLPGGATASTCGSNWCSGSDGSTGANVQGNGPQMYGGEDGSYSVTFYNGSRPCPSDPGGVCWNTTGASNAQSRYQSNTGIGIASYYFGGGAAANNQGLSSYCWGVDQATAAAGGMDSTFRSWRSAQYLMFMDIEDPVSSYGWASTEQAANRQVFNGFYDYTDGSAPCGKDKTPGDLSQPGAYSAPDAWSSAMGSNGGIPNSYVWTYEQCCTGSWTGSNWGGRFQNFGGAQYRWDLQFDQNPDYDDAYEPDWLPVFGIYLGN
jgi:hypothetical protein